MIEYECPNCGEVNEADDESVGEEEMCPECLAFVRIPADATALFPVVAELVETCSESEQEEEDETEEETEPETEGDESLIRPKRRGFWSFLSPSMCMIGGLVGWGGAIALHFWTCYLFAKNWDLFWGIIAFFCPPFPEIVALFSCFGWGAWFYILAVLAVFLGWASLGAAEEAEEKPGIGIGVILATLVAVAAFTYFAYQHATAPTEITAKLAAELDDGAFVIVTVMHASTAEDPLRAANVAEAKAKTREKLADYDDHVMAELRRRIDAYLRFESASLQDLVNHVEKHTDEPGINLKCSAETIRMMNGLPPRLKEKAEKLVEEFRTIIRDVVETMADAPPERRTLGIDAMKRSIGRHWRSRAALYKELLGQDMPVPAPVLSRNGG